jgi:hypothetical protein
MGSARSGDLGECSAMADPEQVAPVIRFAPPGPRRPQRAARLLNTGPIGRWLLTTWTGRPGAQRAVTTTEPSTPRRSRPPAGRSVAYASATSSPCALQATPGRPWRTSAARSRRPSSGRRGRTSASGPSVAWTIVTRPMSCSDSASPPPWLRIALSSPTGSSCWRPAS